MSEYITIIGGGLAGCEAAWQAARRQCQVRLHEMKPLHYSPAHTSPQLAELVCSNSLRSAETSSAVGLLKEEMRRLGSLIMEVADATRVPAGKALAVDREQFAKMITERISNHPRITIIRGEIPELPDCSRGPVIIATGPLTSESLTQSLLTLTGKERLCFYDAIAPILTAESLNMAIIYQASRYDDGPGDYLNCPLDLLQYQRFIEAAKAADKVPLKAFEEPHFFEGCLPIEVMIERGDETLRFGPLKPVGLPHPQTGKIAHAVVQLRKEDLAGTHYNMVGFQTKLTYRAQQEVFRLIPGLEHAEFSRFGSIHRNTFVCAPEILESTLQCKGHHGLLLAGQLTGVEGYVESTAMGLLAGINSTRLVQGKDMVVPPPDTAHGALITHLTTPVKNFQPSNINFGLFPDLGKKIPKKFRGLARAENALNSLEAWQQHEHLMEFEVD